MRQDVNAHDALAQAIIAENSRGLRDSNEGPYAQDKPESAERMVSHGQRAYQMAKALADHLAVAPVEEIESSAFTLVPPGPELGPEVERLNAVVNDFILLAKAQDDEIKRKDELLRRALLLCEWITETPHQRGSVNGQALQVGYAIKMELGV